MTRKLAAAIILSVVALLAVLPVVAFAQGPGYTECQNVSVISYTLDALPARVDVYNPENLLLPHPDYATFDDIGYNDYSPIDLYFSETLYPTGVTSTLVITSYFSSYNHGGNLNGFQLIAPGGERYTATATTANVSITGDRYQLEDYYNVDPGVQTIIIDGVQGPVIGVEVAMGNSYVLAGRWARVGLWQGAGYCAEATPEPFDCATVVDADFDDSYSPASEEDAWVSPFAYGDEITYTTPPITGGIVSLNQYALIAQELISVTTEGSVFTVTLSADAGGETSVPLEIGLSDGIDDLADYHLDFDKTGLNINSAGRVTSVTVEAGGYQTYTATVTGGFSEKWLFLDNTATDNINIDWVCITGVGGRVCSTIDDADFEWGTDDWILANGVIIENGTVGFSEDNNSAIAQIVDLAYQTYTATIIARAPDGGPSQLYAYFTNELGIIPAPIEEPAPITVTGTGFLEYTTVLTNYLEPGDTHYLDINGVGDIEIDWVCIAGEAGICANPVQQQYHGDDLKTWTPIYQPDPDSENLEATWKESYNTAFTYNDGWFQDGGISTIAGMASYILGVGLGENASATVVNAFSDGSWMINAMYLQSPERAVLSEISVQIATNFWATVFFDIKTVVTVFAEDNNGGWVAVGTETLLIDSADFEREKTITVSIDEPDAPTRYMVSVASGTLGGTDFGVFVNKITATGCFYGAAFSGECVVLDPDLSEGDNGHPESFYWQYSDSAISSPGHVTLYTEQRDFLQQHTYAEVPGTYYANIAIEHVSGDYCQLDVNGLELTTGSAGFGSDFFNEQIVCETNGISQTYTIPLQLPVNPFILSLEPSKGTMNIHRVCLVSSILGGSCLNANPFFIDGLTGYSPVGGLLGAGGVLLSPGDVIKAAPVGGDGFYAGNGPWLLELEATSAVTDDDALLAITPGLNPVETTIDTNAYHAISQTQTITYVISKNDDDQRLIVMGQEGPSVYDYDGSGKLWLSQYCIMTHTGTVWYGDKTCTTVTNPDFLHGLSGWDSTNVSAVGGWVVFNSGGAVEQTVNPVNVNPNPDIEIDTTGWAGYGGTGISQSTSQAHNGNASLQLTNIDASGYARIPTDINENGTFTAVAWLKGVGDSIGDSARLGLLEYNPPSTFQRGTWSDYTVVTGDWQPLYVTAVLENGDNLQVAVYLADSENGSSVFYDDIYVVPGDSIPVAYSSNQDTTLHWIAKAPGNTPIEATVTVSSTAGAFTTTQTIAPGFSGSEFFTPFEIGGDVEIAVLGDAGLELDYVCLLGGTYTEPGDPGDGTGEGWQPGVGDGRCAPPPMMVLTDTLDAWLPAIWIWGTAPTNYEIVGSYSAAWLRFIGCQLVDFQNMMEAKLNTIIALLGIQTVLTGIDALASVISALADSIALVEETLDDLIQTILDDGLTLAVIIGALLVFFAALMGLIALILGLIYLFWAIPQEFWASFSDALQSDSSVLIPLPDSAAHPLYNIYAGLQMFNQTMAGSNWIFVMAIIAMALGSISLFLWTIKRVNFRW